MPKIVNVKIRGTSDLLQHRRPPESEEEENNRKSGEIDYSKDVEKAVYRDSEIGCYIPAEHIEASLKLSGSDFPVKGGGMKNYKKLMNARIIVEPDKIPFIPAKTKVDYVDERWGKIPPRTGAMVWLRRPAFKKGWEAEFNVLVLDDQIPLETLKNILVNAGRFYSIGDHKPRFGRFEVVEFKENKKKKK